jgi:ubiquinone/menaquinone biosynthesis C-methylase UbiE
VGLLSRFWTRTPAAFDHWAATYEREAAAMIESRGYSYCWLGSEITNALGVAAEALVLEVGTGPGNLGVHVAEAARQVSILGVDISLEMISLAKSRGVYGCVARASFEHLPFETDEFDGLFSAFVLHSVRRQVHALSEVRRVVKPGGPVVLIDLCPARGRQLAAAAAGFLHSLNREHGAPAIYRPVEAYVRMALEVGFEIAGLRPLGRPRAYQHYMLTMRNTK